MSSSLTYHLWYIYLAHTSTAPLHVRAHTHIHGGHGRRKPGRRNRPLRLGLLEPHPPNRPCAQRGPGDALFDRTPREGSRVRAPRGRECARQVSEVIMRGGACRHLMVSVSPFALNLYSILCLCSN